LKAIGENPQPQNAISILKNKNNEINCSKSRSPSFI